MAASTGSRAGIGPAGIAGPAWLALAVLGALPLFGFGLRGLAEAWARPEFSHGPVIPVLSFYLFLHALKAVPPPVRPVTDRWPGVATIALALALALLGNLVRIADIVFYALIVWTWGLVLTGFGWRRGRGFWPAVLHLVFMLPLPQFLYWKVNTGLQMLSSQVGVEVLRLAGVPVYLDGNVIDLGVMQLMVAEACSGLRYLFPILSFTYVFAVLYRGPLRRKLALLLAAVPLAVAMNALRIGVIGILVDARGPGAATGFLHLFEGWVVFLSCIGILLAMAKAMHWLAGDRRPLGEALDLDFSGLGEQLARVRDVAPSPGLVAAACLTAALGAAWLLAPARLAAEPARARFDLFPHALAGWSGTAAPLAPDVERALAADDYLAAVYRHPAEAQPVDLFLSYYLRQTEGAWIHSPAVCLPSAGWEVSAIRAVAVPLPGAPDGLALNRAVIQKGLGRQLVYYWFAGRGRAVTNDFAAKFYAVADSMARGRTDGGLVRLVTPIGPGEAEADADARLARFLDAAAPSLPRFIPD